MPHKAGKIDVIFVNNRNIMGFHCIYIVYNNIYKIIIIIWLYIYMDIMYTYIIAFAKYIISIINFVIYTKCSYKCICII